MSERGSDTTESGAGAGGAGIGGAGVGGAGVGGVLEEDHHRIDAQFAAFAHSLDGRGAPDVTSLAAAARGLRRHIMVEEELHFPPLRAGGLIGPIFVMLREHGEIWDGLDRLDALVAAGAAPADLQEVWRALEQALAAHNLKEERILYPSGDSILTPEESEAILAAIASERDVPAGWVCEFAGRTSSAPVNSARQLPW